MTQLGFKVADAPALTTVKPIKVVARLADVVTDAVRPRIHKRHSLADPGGHRPGKSRKHLRPGQGRHIVGITAALCQFGGLAHCLLILSVVGPIQGRKLVLRAALWRSQGMALEANALPPLAEGAELVAALVKGCAADHAGAAGAEGVEGVESAGAAF